MAFTETEKAGVRLYLGWPTRYFQTDTRLENAFVSVSPEAEALVRTELGRCISIDAKLVDAEDRFVAKQVSSITLPGGQEIALLRSRGRQAAGRIAALFGVEVRHDVFSGTGPRETYSYAGSSGGGSNMIRHG